MHTFCIPNRPQIVHKSFQIAIIASKSPPKQRPKQPLSRFPYCVISSRREPPALCRHYPRSTSDTIAEGGVKPTTQCWRLPRGPDAIYPCREHVNHPLARLSVAPRPRRHFYPCRRHGFVVNPKLQPGVGSRLPPI